MSTTRFLPGQLTPIKKNTHTNKTLKLVGKAGSASRLDSGLLKRGDIGGVNQKKWAFGHGSIWDQLAGKARWLPEGDHTPTRCNGICVNFYLRTTLREKWAKILAFLPTKSAIYIPKWDDEHFRHIDDMGVPPNITGPPPPPSKRTHQNMATSK